MTSEHTRGRLSLDTGSGTVSVTDAQGEVKLDTGSGSVTIDGMKGETLDIDTGSGSVRGHDIDTKMLKIDVGSGGLSLDRITSTRVTVDAGSGRTELGFLQPVEDIAIDAGSGGVTLRLPAAQGAEVDIEPAAAGSTAISPCRRRVSRETTCAVRSATAKGGSRSRAAPGPSA